MILLTCNPSVIYGQLHSKSIIDHHRIRNSMVDDGSMSRLTMTAFKFQQINQSMERQNSNDCVALPQVQRTQQCKDLSLGFSSIRCQSRCVHAVCVCGRNLSFLNKHSNACERSTKYRGKGLFNQSSPQRKISHLAPKKEKETIMECSMCGDVGFAEHLFQCSKCRFRFQHKYCSRGYFRGDHNELCDWCFVESDQSSGSPSNLHSGTKSKPPLTKNDDVRGSNAFNTLRKRSANAYSLKRIEDETQKTTGWLRSPSKTNMQMQKTRMAPARSRRKMKLLHEIVC